MGVRVPLRGAGRERGDERYGGRCGRRCGDSRDGRLAAYAGSWIGDGRLAGGDASGDWVETGERYLIGFHFRGAFEHVLQTFQDVGVGFAVIDVRVFLGVPGADGDHFRRSGIDQQNFVLETLLLAKAVDFRTPHFSDGKNFRPRKGASHRSLFSHLAFEYRTFFLRLSRTNNPLSRGPLWRKRT